MLKQRLPWVFFALSALSFYLFHNHNTQAKLDFYNAWGVAQLAPEMGNRNIYSKPVNQEMGIALVLHGESVGGAAQIAAQEMRQNWRSNTNATGTPFFYGAVNALSVNDYNLDLTLFSALSAITFAAALGVFMLLAGLPPLLSVLFTIIACFLSKPVQINEYEGNMGSYQLGFLAAYALLWNRSKHFLSGFTLTVGVIFKPTLHWVLIAHIAFTWLSGLKNETKKFIFGILIGATTCFIVSLCWIGNMGSWFDFIKSLAVTLHPASYGSLSPVGWIWRIAHWNASIPFALFAISTITYISIKLAKKPHLPREYPQLTMAIGIPLMLLTSSLVWAHYYTLLIPILAWMIRDLKTHRAHAIAAVVVMIILSPVAGRIYPNEILAWGAYATSALIVISCATLEVLRPARA